MKKNTNPFLNDIPSLLKALSDIDAIEENDSDFAGLIETPEDPPEKAAHQDPSAPIDPQAEQKRY